MPATACLFGPPFVLEGATYSGEYDLNFIVEFNSLPEQESVLAYQWFLDGTLLLNHRQREIYTQVSAGPHTIGVRILTAQGWSGIKYHMFYSAIIDTSLTLVGPDVLPGEATAVYELYASFGYNPPISIKLTDKASFSIDMGGVFDHNILNVAKNDTGFNKFATITATLEGGMTSSLPLTILSSAPQYPSILVIDLFNDTALDVGAIIINANINGTQTMVYTGHNFLPSNSLPADAYILASDLVDNETILKWRSQFNIGKLISDYPTIQDFEFEIRGRSDAEKSITGAFGLKDHTGVMAMNGSTGSYVPTVIGGNDVYYDTFETHVKAGANGNYNKDYLSMLISFNFNVPTNTLTYNIVNEPIFNDFDFMALKYEWAAGAGSDLDILVGFENTGTIYDNMYVGFGGTSGRTVPPNTIPQIDAYLWWASDNTGSSGVEAVLVGLEKFLLDLPTSANIIEIGLYAVWFGTPITGNFTLSLTTYKGGSMSLVGTDFVNTGGMLVDNEQILVHTMKRRTGGTPADYYRIGKLSYNKTTKVAVLHVEDN